MKKSVYILLFVFLSSCTGQKEGGLEVTVNEIDAYVTDKTSDTQVYDVSQSLRFSCDKETYEVVRYMQNDSVILYLETHTTEDDQTVRKTFYKHGLPIFVDEYIASNITENPFTQRKTYLDGVNISEAYQKNAATESELEYIEYEDNSISIDEFDFEKPKNAMEQKEEFRLVFEEFIIIEPQTYLILENVESEFNVALFVDDIQHPFIQEILVNENQYKGKEIFITHQFVIMNSIERMLFIDGVFKENQSSEKD